MSAIKDSQQPVSTWNNGVPKVEDRTNRAGNKNVKKKFKKTPLKKRSAD